MAASEEFPLRRSSNSALRGFGIVEAVIAVAILAIVIYFVAQFTTGARKQEGLIRGSAECQNAVRSVVDSFSALGVSDNVAPAFIAPATPGGSHKPAGPPISWLPNATPEFWYSADVIGTGANPGIYNSQMLFNSASAAQAFLNSDSKFCEPGGRGGRVPSLDRLISLPNAQVWLNILPMRFDNNDYTDCPGINGQAKPLIARPKGGPNLVTAISNKVSLGNDNIQYEIIATVAYTDPNGQNRACQESTKLAYRWDKGNFSAAPTFVGKPMNAVGPSGTQLIEQPSGVFTSCIGPPGANTVQLKVKFDKLEPGSVVLCQAVTDEPVTATPADLYSCDTAKFAGQAGATVAAWDLPTNTMTLSFVGLAADAKYTLKVYSVDTAGNVSAPAQQSFLVDQTPPSMGTVAEVSDASTNGKPWFHIGLPGDGQYNRGPFVGFPKVNWSLAQVQCDTAAATFAGSYSGTLPDNWITCSCSGDLDPATCRGTCGAKTNTPMNEGPHTVTMTANDACATGGSSSFSWANVQSFTPKDISATTLFDNDKLGAEPFYSITVPEPNTSSVKHYAVQCDCNAAADGSVPENNPVCSAKANLGAGGCVEPNPRDAPCNGCPGVGVPNPTIDAHWNFTYRYMDICGRDSQLKKYNAIADARTNRALSRFP